MTCDAFDVVIVPFPFTDVAQQKRRPAVVISRRAFNESGYTMMAMVTSSFHETWPGDVLVSDYGAAGLPKRSAVRLKIFTIDNGLILRRAGTLGQSDQLRVVHELEKFVALNMKGEV